MTRLRLDLIELTGVIMVAGGIGFVVGRVAPTAASLQNPQAVVLGWDGGLEVGRLARVYGPGRYSRNAEEWIVRDFFHDERGGVFLDIGANHYRAENNTYYLETALGWSGIAVEPQQQFASDYARYRPRTRFVPVFASDTEGTIPFFVPPANSLVASASRDFTVQEGAPGEERTVPTTTLSAVLDRFQIAHLDFLSMDIELAEPKALAGFDIGRFRPRLVCIEAHEAVRQGILDYFYQHEYVVVGKYLRADSANLYFTPAAR